MIRVIGVILRSCTRMSIVRSFIAKVFARFYAVLENLEENGYRLLIWRWTDDTWRNMMGVLRVLMSSELCSRKTKTIRILEGTNRTVLRFNPTWSVWNILNHFIFLFFCFFFFLLISYDVYCKLCRHCGINNNYFKYILQHVFRFKQ